MREELISLIIAEAKYLIDEKATVRAVAKRFSRSKSAVHKDVAKRLEKLDRPLYKKVRAVLDVNLAERHLRGGEATRKKYRKTLDKKT